MPKPMQSFVLILISLLFATNPLLAARKAAAPDFGPNVFVFSPSMPAANIQQQINRVYAIEQHNEFGPQRYAFLFLPGTYHVDVPIGFYTQAIGLGASPDDTHIDGNLHVDAASRHNNATTTFWRGAEGLSVTRPGEPCAGLSRRLYPFAACMCTETWCSTSSADGPAAAGSPTA